MIYAYILLFSMLTVLKHLSFNTSALDLGLFDQMMWTTLNGRFFYISILNSSQFSQHMSPLLLLILPIYAIFQTPITLLIIQTISIGLGAFPLYLIAREKLDEKGALIISGCYLLYPPLEYANMFDFHMESLGILLLITAFYFLFKNKYKAYVIFLIFSLFVKEYVALIGISLGLYIILIKKERNLGTLTSIVSIIWLYFSIYIAIPLFGNNSYPFTHRYSHFGESFFEIIFTILMTVSPNNMSI